MFAKRTNYILQAKIICIYQAKNTIYQNAFIINAKSKTVQNV